LNEQTNEKRASNPVRARLEGEPREPRQYVKYTFFAVDPAWRRLPFEEREAGKAELADAVGSAAAELLVLRSYSLVGTRGDADFMLWSVSGALEEQGALITRVFSTAIGPYLRIAHSYLAMTKHSQYVRDHHHEGQEGTRLTVLPGGAKYLFVYPMIKQRRWYALPFEERNRIMRQHIKLGHKYPTVKINTSYSFGLDDQEFVVAFESDYPEDFLDLVEELRGSESSAFTEVDIPIFTCIARDLRAALDALGSAPAVVGAGRL
jgi:chlorite dismutase